MWGGYNNYWQVLNAKDYGVPQNRERVFIVSIRKDVDDGTFMFPSPFPLTKRLKDVLEDSVDEKYYLSKKFLAYCTDNDKLQKGKGTGFRFVPTEAEGIASSITTKSGSRMTDNFIKQVAQMYPNSGNPQAGRIYDADGISPAMDTCQGGNRMPKIAGREATKKGFAEAYEGDSINLEHPNSKTRRGRVGKGVAQTLTTSCNQAVVEPFIAASRGRNPDHPSDRTVGSPTVQRLEPYSQGISNTLTSVQKDNLVVEPSVRIRKLTPKECFRLMGFDDEDFYRAERVNSNSQLYKQAGNSIVVNVLEEILTNLIHRTTVFAKNLKTKEI